MSEKKIGDLKGFIEYVKREWGYTITVEQSSIPDSFEEIFGASFLKENIYSNTIEYDNDACMHIYVSEETTDYLIDEMEFAA